MSFSSKMIYLYTYGGLSITIIHEKKQMGHRAGARGMGHTWSKWLRLQVRNFKPRLMGMFIFNLTLNTPAQESLLTASDFKDAVTLRFGHSDGVIDLSIQRRFSHLIALLSNFSNLFSFLGITRPKVFDFMPKVSQIPFIKHFR